MKKLLFAFCAALMAQVASAQNDDPIVMTINGEDIPREVFFHQLWHLQRI